jgi:hypothetical protein
LYRVAVPFPLTLLTILELKIRVLPISRELLEISSNTPYISSLSISFLRERANGPPGVVIMPLLRSLIEVSLSLVSFLVKKVYTTSMSVVAFVKNPEIIWSSGLGTCVGISTTTRGCLVSLGISVSLFYTTGCLS